jgi:NADH-quinone oxidoreductase subunit J
MIEEVLFYIFSVLVCGGAIAVVATQNVVRMAFWLVVSLGSVSALFFLLHADFLGAAQLLIYVGGTVVLLVFGVMLTASGPFVQIRTSPAELIFGATVGGALFFVLFSSIAWVDWVGIASRLPATPGVPAVSDARRVRAAEGETANPDSSAAQSELNFQEQGQTVRQLGFGFLGLRPDRNLKEGGAQGLAPGYLLPFEIVSIHLLVVLIGASYLARAKRRVVVDETQGLN